MAKRNELIRKGDLVQIVIPEFFDRAKYDNDFRDILESAKLSKEDQIITENMIGIFDPNFLFTKDKAFSNLQDHIYRGIAAYRMEKAKKSGNKKVMITYQEDNLTDTYGKVTNTFVVYTGEFSCGNSTFNEYSMEYSHESSSLINRKYHRILEIEFHNPDGFYEFGCFDDFMYLKIEDCNVRRII